MHASFSVSQIAADGGEIRGLYRDDLWLHWQFIEKPNAKVVVKLPIQLAVLGAGLIGKRHMEHINMEPEAELYAVVDPRRSARRSHRLWV